MNDFETTEAAFTEGSQIINEICSVGVGIGGGFSNTNELHIMKFKEAMKTTNKDKWMKAVKEELEDSRNLKFLNSLNLIKYQSLQKCWQPLEQ